MKNVKIKILISLLFLLTGCLASSRKFATIGDTEFYAVKSPSLLGPSINLVITIRTNDHSPIIQGQAAGNGVVGSVINAAGFAGGAALFGQSLRPDNDQTVVVDTVGPPLPPAQRSTAIGNPSNTHPFSHDRQRPSLSR